MVQPSRKLVWPRKVQLCRGCARIQVQSKGMDWIGPGHGTNKAVQSGKVFFEEVGVDGERRLRPFRGGHDDPLHRARRVAGHVQTRQVRRLVLAGADGALVVELAAEPERQLRLLRLAGGEE